MKAGSSSHLCLILDLFASAYKEAPLTKGPFVSSTAADLTGPNDTL